MLNLLNTLTDLKELKNIAKKLSDTVSIGDIYLLSGELGSGKTTFARFFINSIFDNNSIQKPESIKSPSFPLMINYSIKNFNISHYDLYRLKNVNDLKELNIDENIKKNITIIEWPELFINKFNQQNYYLVKLKIINSNSRMIQIKYIKKN